MDRGLFDRLLNSPRLPSLPTVAIEILELITVEDVDIKAIATSISHDAVLSAKLLKTVNSSYYSQRRQIGTISEALVVLGLNGVKTMALGFSLINNLTPPAGSGFDHIQFWRRSVYSAVAARALAQHIGLIQQEEAFLAGLMHDLGVLSMIHVMGEAYHKIFSQAGADHDKLLDIEQQQLGFEHAQVGASLAERWNLPRLLCEPIRFHAKPNAGPEDLKSLIRCVALGCDVANLFIDTASQQPVMSYQSRIEQWFGLSQAQGEQLLTSIHHETVAVAKIFELPCQIELPEVILARANEALIEISIEQQNDVHQMQRHNEHLAKEMVTDSLTGAANRRGLDECVQEQYQLTKETRGVLSVLFLDVDNFKGINDHHGHHVGDCALITLIKTIQKMVPDPNQVARFGGDEFAIVLRGVGRADAMILAETIRQRIASTVIESEEEGPVNMTVSIGVATYQDHCFANEKQLFLAVDQALYAAKAGGRNRVCLYSLTSKMGVSTKSKAS